MGRAWRFSSLNEVIPDVIFMDINMPGIDGVEVLRFLRRDPMTVDVPVIIVSAEEQAETKQAAFDAGANYYIVKPPTLEEIEKALELVVHLTLPTDPDQTIPARRIRGCDVRSFQAILCRGGLALPRMGNSMRFAIRNRFLVGATAPLGRGKPTSLRHIAGLIENLHRVAARPIAALELAETSAQSPHERNGRLCR